MRFAVSAYQNSILAYVDLRRKCFEICGFTQLANYLIATDTTCRPRSGRVTNFGLRGRLEILTDIAPTFGIEIQRI